MGILNALSRLDADHHVLGVGIVFAQIVAVIGRHQWKAEIFLQSKQAGMDAVLRLQALVLDLKKEILPAKNVSVSGSGAAGGWVLFFGEELCYLPFQAA